LRDLGSVTPRLDIGAGYETLTSRLSDKGVASSRSYEGVIVGAEVEARFRLGARWSLGPTAGAWAGVFGRASLDAPGVTRSGGVDGARAHGWLVLGLRLGVSP